MIANMRKFTIVSTVLLLCVTFISNEAKSSHIMGSDMEINCLGDSTYQVNVDLYRDCRGISTFNGELTFASMCGNVNVKLDSSALQDVRDVTPICESECNQCDGGGSECLDLGIEVYEYTTQVDLSDLMAQGCCDFTIEGLDECCRNQAIDNVDLNSGETYWVENTFNPCNAAGSCPSTPKFENNPVALICEDEQFVFDQGVSADPQDSLVYELSDPLSENGVPVDWISPWNKYEPLTYFGMGSQHFDRHSGFPRGFHLDSLTGELKFTPQELMAGLISIEVRQYRDGQKISSMQRDMQFEVIDCNVHNEPPVAEYEAHHEVCAGNNITIPIDVADPDSTGASPDSVFIYWNEGIPDAEFTPDSGSVYASGKFSWTPENTDASAMPHSFEFISWDDNCLNPGLTSSSVVINVNPTPDAEIITHNQCGEVIFHASVEHVNDASFEWIGEDSLYSTEDSFSHQYSAPGKYPLSLTVSSSGCEKVIYDTVHIELLDVDWETELQNCNEFSAKAFSTQEDSVDFTWNTWDGTKYQADSFSQELPEAGMYHVSLEVDAPGCQRKYEDSIFFPGILDVELTDTTVCEQENVLIGAQVHNPAGIPSFSWSTGHDSAALMLTAVSDSMVSVQVSDTLGCSATDTMQVKTVPKPSEPVITESNDTLYAGTTADHFIWMTNGDTLHQGSSGYFVPSTSDSIQVTAVNAGMCSQTSHAYNFTTFLSTPVASKGEVELYPNPASQELNITTPVSAQNYQITDLSGRTILERSATDNEGTSKTLDISDLEAGTYFIRIKMESGTFTGQWIKDE